MRLATLPVFLALVAIGCSSDGVSLASPGAGGSSGRGGVGGSSGRGGVGGSAGASAAGASGTRGFTAGKGGSSVDPCSGAYVDGSVAGGPACATPSASDCHLQRPDDPYDCTLDEACARCASLDAGGTCGAFIEGTMYDYIQLFNVDVATVFVYDKTGKLVAELQWGANGGSFGCAWRCAVGPPNFDATEAMALLPAFSSGSLLASACAARDGGLTDS